MAFRIFYSKLVDGYIDVKTTDEVSEVIATPIPEIKHRILWDEVNAEIIAQVDANKEDFIVDEIG